MGIVRGVKGWREMGKDSTLTVRQGKLLVALFEEPTIAAAAESAGVPLRTVWRWLEGGLVADELARRQDAILAQAGAGLTQDMGAARAELVGIMGNPLASASARVSAARAILELGLRCWELATLARRVTALEDHLLKGGNE